MDVSGGFADRVLRAAMNGLSVRQRVIADNLANVDTPDFSASKVDFESALQSAIAQHRDGDLPLLRTASLGGGQDDLLAEAQPQVVRLDNAQSSDGNGVDVDQEMVELTQTNLTYNALAQMVSSRFQLMRTVINDGRR